MLHIVSKFFENIAHLRVRFYFTKNSLLNIAIILVFVSIKIGFTGLLGFSLAKNEADSARRKRKDHTRFGKYPVCFS